MSELYTVVQHSAWVTKRDPQFEHALESAAITEKQANKVRALGGLVFDSYGKAEDYAEAEQYPPGYAGLIPVARGTFTRHKLAEIEGRPIYVPARHDADGQPYIGYFRRDLVTGFLWSGNNDDPVQVTAEMSEPVTETFEVSIAQDQDTADVLAEFKRQCDEWAEADRG